MVLVNRLVSFTLVYAVYLELGQTANFVSKNDRKICKLIGYQTDLLKFAQNVALPNQFLNSKKLIQIFQDTDLFVLVVNEWLDENTQKNIPVAIRENVFTI